MDFPLLLTFLALIGLSLAVPLEESEERQKRSDAEDEEVSLSRKKRCLFGCCGACQFGYVVGETILDIQCKRGYLTVCAPDGPDACPVGYTPQTNVGACGFATLNHYLNTTNIAGTCCYKLPSSATGTTTTTAGSASSSTTASYLIPQIIAYPVYAQYPYGIGGGGGGGNTQTTAYPSPGGSYGSSYGR